MQNSNLKTNKYTEQIYKETTNANEASVMGRNFESRNVKQQASYNKQARIGQTASPLVKQPRTEYSHPSRLHP
jgi:hypothetical protein